MPSPSNPAPPAAETPSPLGKPSHLWTRIWIALILALIVQALVSAVVFHWLFFSDPIEAAARRAAFRAMLHMQGGTRPPPWKHILFSPYTTTVLTALVVSAVTVPILRKLTRRLERLQQGVRALGEGDLRARVPVEGNDEVAHLAASFNTAATRIESLMHSHKSLLAYTSHELRTPLTRLRLAIETLAGATDAERRAQLLVDAKRDLSELDELIGNILLASRLDATERAPIEHDDVDLLALLAEEAAHFNAEAQGDWVHVEGDEKLLRRAVRNLLDNAQRHAPGTPPEVTLTAVDGGAVIRVCDQGPGVPSADAERIFMPFERLQGRGDGTGLGLALVRAIARRHGGEARCVPRPRGACFEIWLGKKP